MTSDFAVNAAVEIGKLYARLEIIENSMKKMMPILDKMTGTFSQIAEEIGKLELRIIELEKK